MNEWSRTHKETETQTQEEKHAEEATERGQVEEKPEGMPEVLSREADPALALRWAKETTPRHHCLAHGNRSP